MFYVSLQIDLTYKIRIGSTVTKNSLLPLVANPGMEPCTEEGGEKTWLFCHSHMRSESQRKMWGNGKPSQNTNMSLQNQNRGKGS